jgi:ElaB/YqjD/DUF883 family membrane-anchored ribosome-binding protein
MKNRISELQEPGVPGHDPREVDRAAAWQQAQQQLSQWSHGLRSQLAQHPKLTLGVGLALGVCIGWLIKRR